MKNISKTLGGLVLLACLILARQASATILSVPYYEQRSFYAASDTNHLHNLSQWCWNACSEMVLDTPLSSSYPGTFYDQDTIAAYGSESSNYWNWIFGSTARFTNTTTGAIQPTLNGIDLILKKFGPLNSRGYDRALTSTELQNEIDAGRPAIARLGWSTISTNRTYVNNAGGHFVVLYGFDGTVVDINDPWPDTGPIIQVYSTFSDAGGKIYAGNSARFKWSHTLTLGSSLDVVFLIDSTGSMGSTIYSVKEALINISSNIFALFPDARIAVKDFKDSPAYADGDSAYLDEVDAPFTTNRSTIISALNSVYADGGGDEPEAHWTALINTMNGDVGTWRTNPTPRIIIIASDTHGHDPVEPWTGGHTISDVIAKATTVGKEISIYGLAAGSDAIADMEVLAAGTGGAEFDTGYSGVADGILAVINQASKSTRHPQGTVASSRPTFTFELGLIGMGGVPTKYVIQILQSNATTGVWTTYLQAAVTNTSYIPASALPIGAYRWRLGGQMPATTILSPAGEVLSTVPAGLVFENDFTEFYREAATPGDATPLTVSTDLKVNGTNVVIATGTDSFSYSTASIPLSERKLALIGKAPLTFTFSAGLYATSYGISFQAYDTATKSWKTFKTLTVTPTGSAATIAVKTTGFKVGKLYRWTIVSYNSDGSSID